MHYCFGGMVAACLTVPGLALAQTGPQAEGPAGIAVSGTLFTGYFDDGYGDDGVILRSDINLSGERALANGVTLGFSADIDIIARGDDPYGQTVDGQVRAFLDDYTLWADFGAWGKLSYTTEGHCTSEEAGWFDGEFYSENNTSVWNVLPPNYRCVGGRAPLAAFMDFSLPADDHIKYELQRGRFGLEAYYDPELSFTEHRSGQTFQGDDTRTVLNGGDLPPRFELNLTYNFDFASVTVGQNDLDDRFVRVVAPLPAQNLLLVYSREWQSGVGTTPLDIVYADWAPQSLGVFRGATFLFFNNENGTDTTHSYVGQVKFGGDRWNANVGYDVEGDWAIEAGFDLDDNTRLLAGYDNGMNGNNGMDRFFPGAPDPNVGWRFAEDRGASWEIGIEMRF